MYSTASTSLSLSLSLSPSHAENGAGVSAAAGVEGWVCEGQGGAGAGGVGGVAGEGGKYTSVFEVVLGARGCLCCIIGCAIKCVSL